MASSFQPLSPGDPAPRTFCRAGNAAASHNAVPALLLLGWADAPLKYVQKYADIYPPESTVLVQLSRFTDFLCSDSTLASLVAPVIDWLHTHPQAYPHQPLQHPQNPQPHATLSSPRHATPLRPAVVHLFSNGGALLLHALHAAAARAGTRLHIGAGITIDSAPSEGSLFDGAKLLSRVAARGGPLQYVLFIFVVVGMLLYRLVQTLTGQPTLFGSIWQVLADPACSCPRLVLYSETDALVASSSVEKFVVYARGRGVEVVAQRWKGSAHVRHYVDHADEYRALVREHIVAPACKQLAQLQ